MAARTIRDWIAAGFLARDKASVDAIIKDAEKDGDEDADHKEPDGDEGDTHVHLHLSKNGDAKTGDTAVDAALKAMDTRITGIADQVSKITDAIAKASDGDLPPWLKKDGDGDDDSDGDDDKKEDTNDAGELPGEEGAQTAQALPSAEPDLMEADPALHTGPSKMGDAAYNAALSKALAKLVKDTRARAEILSPGFKFATIDSAPKADTAKRLCGMRREALTRASTTDAGKQLLGRYTGDAIKALPCAMVRLVFLDTSDRAREINNAQGRSVGTNDVRSFRQGQSAKLKSINERNAEFWAKQSGRPN